MIRLISLFFILFSLFPLVAQTPMVKVDLNIENRTNLTEINELGYTSWVLARVHEASLTEKGITFTLTAKSPGVSPTFRSYWAKAYVQTPNLMRLIGDGLMVDKDSLTNYPNKPAAMELKISGLSAGTHTLQTYHNMWDDSTSVSYAPLNFYLNGELIKSNLKRSVKVMDNSLATVLLTTLNVTQAGQDMILRIEANPDYVPYGSKTKDYNFCINAFELNADAASKQAYSPVPADRDYHVDADTGSIYLQWQPAANNYTKFHTLYFGTDSTTVASAQSTNTSICKGTFNYAEKSYKIENLYNLDTYYWRVDQTDSAGSITKGKVWSFRKRHDAFPGAEGYGRYAIGGRGGKVIYVTNLNDAGPGSFRYAVENYTGPRTIVFNVSGIISLNSRLVVNSPYVTIAGQTAPGKGVCFRWSPLGFTGNDIIAQHLRMRLGYGVTYDGMGLTGANNSILDHASISWTIDEAFSSRNAQNITLQNTLISEALNAADHAIQQSKHGYAGTISGRVGSFHHNLLAHCYGRNFSMGAAIDGAAVYDSRLDLFNNVVYNYGKRATDGSAHEANFVNNYYKKGAATDLDVCFSMDFENYGTGTLKAYFSGNIIQENNGTFQCNGTDNTCGRVYNLRNGNPPVTYDVFVNEPLFKSYATIHSVTDAYKRVLSDVGCTQPVFDDHDVRIIKETLTGTYSCNGSVTGLPGLPDREGDVGAWENYPGFNRAASWDTDLDGLPDWWETAIGTSPNSAPDTFTDSNADTDKDGYTNMEAYLQWMSKPHYFWTPTSAKKLTIDLSQYTKGFTNQPTYSVSNVVNGTVALQAGKIAEFTSATPGFAEFTFTVQDAEGSSLTKKIGVFVGNTPADEPFTYTYSLDRAGTQQVSVSPTGIVPVADRSITSIVSYPSPVKDKLNVKFESTTDAKADFIIYDITGAVVYRDMKNISGDTNHFSFDLTNFQSGIYTLRITNSSVNETVKFVKL